MTEYTMRAGVLCRGREETARIKSALTGARREIRAADGAPLLTADIQLPSPGENRDDVRLKRYVCVDGSGAELALARPDYAEEEGPEQAGWPACRVPRADRALVRMLEGEYRLWMENSQNYVLKDGEGREAVRISHRGLTGGWRILAEERFSPGLICAVFVFCRYLEQENEFTMV